MKILACAAALFALSGAAMAQQSPTNAPAKPVVVNIMNAEGQAVGPATLSPAASGVKIVLDIKRLPPGEHSIHIHQMSKCDPPDFKSAGPHFSPAGHSHDSTPAGDIPDFSLIVGKDGTAHVSTVAPNVTLGDCDSRRCRWHRYRRPAAHRLRRHYPVVGSQDSAKNCARRAVPLLVCHREDAVPSHGRLVEQILLAAFPVHAGRAIVGRAVQNFLKRVLGLFPIPLAIKLARDGEILESLFQVV